MGSPKARVAPCAPAGCSDHWRSHGISFPQFQEGPTPNQPLDVCVPMPVCARARSSSRAGKGSHCPGPAVLVPCAAGARLGKPRNRQPEVPGKEGTNTLPHQGKARVEMNFGSPLLWLRQAPSILALQQQCRPDSTVKQIFRTCRKFPLL